MSTHVPLRRCLHVRKGTAKAAVEPFVKVGDVAEGGHCATRPTPPVAHRTASPAAGSSRTANDPHGVSASADASVRVPSEVVSLIGEAGCPAAKELKMTQRTRQRATTPALLRYS